LLKKRATIERLSVH